MRGLTNRRLGAAGELQRIEPVDVRRRSLPWLPVALVFVLAVALSFALHIRGTDYLKSMLHIDGSNSAADVRLKTQHVGDRIQLSWDRDSPAVKSASGGVLHIDDGTQHRDVELDASLLANGLILYRPVSDDVSFQLEVHGPQGERAAGGTRLFDGSRNADVNHVASTTVVVQTRSQPRPLVAQETPKIIEPVKPAAAPPPVEIPLASPPAKPAAPVFEDASTRLEPTPAPVEQVARNTEPAQLTPTPVSATSNPPVEEPKVSPRLDGFSDLGSKVTPQPGPRVPAAAPPITAAIGQSIQPAAVVPCKPIREVLPDLRRFGGRPVMLSGELRIEVAVKVNNKGGVTEAKVIGDRSGLPNYMAYAATDAARRWTFQPATLRGQSIASDHVIVFKFGPDRR